MKSPVWRALALFTLAVVVIGMATDANAARRSALAGNYFIDDADDMFAFPQLYGQYQNMAIIDFAPSDGFSGDMGGNATLVWGGENHSFRVSTGRADMFSRSAMFSVGGFDRIYDWGLMGGMFPDFPEPRFTQWWDVGWATKLGDMPFGIGLTWLSDASKSDDGTNPPDPDDSYNNYNLQVGLSPFETLQLVAEFGIGGYSDDVEGTDGQNDWSTMNFNLTARGDIPNFAGLSWRYLGAFTYINYSPDNDAIDDQGIMNFRASFGPTFGTPGEWLVAGYMTFSYMSFTDDQAADSSDDDETFTMVDLPGYTLSGEYYLNNWFVVRAGVVSNYFFVTDEEGPAKDSDRFYSYTWTAGFGIDKDSFGLDFALNEDLLHSGYVLNGNLDDDAFAYITAWFNW